jgi:hypothetical protein
MHAGAASAKSNAIDPTRTSLATEGDSLGGRHSTAVDDVFGAGDAASSIRVGLQVR